MKKIVALFAVLSLVLTGCKSNKFLNPNLDPKQLAPLKQKAIDMAAKLSDNWPASFITNESEYATGFSVIESYTVKFTTKYTPEQVATQLVGFGEFTARAESVPTGDGNLISAVSPITLTGSPAASYFSYSGVFSKTVTRTATKTVTSGIDVYVFYYPTSTWSLGTYFYQGKPIRDNIVVVLVSRVNGFEAANTVQPTSTLTTTRQP